MASVGENKGLIVVESEMKGVVKCRAEVDIGGGMSNKVIERKISQSSMLSEKERKRVMHDPFADLT